MLQKSYINQTSYRYFTEVLQASYILPTAIPQQRTTWNPTDILRHLTESRLPKSYRGLYTQSYRNHSELVHKSLTTPIQYVIHFTEITTLQKPDKNIAATLQKTPQQSYRHLTEILINCFRNEIPCRRIPETIQKLCIHLTDTLQPTLCRNLTKQNLCRNPTTAFQTFSQNLYTYSVRDSSLKPYSNLTGTLQTPYRNPTAT